MADTIPDLWPTEGLKPSVLKPIAILRTQATHLSQKTRGLLVGEVTVIEGDKGQKILNLDVVAPALNNYRVRLLSAEHTKDAIYPAKIVGQGLTTSVTTPGFMFRNDTITTQSVEQKTAYSDREFIEIVQESLQSRKTIAMLQSLIGRSDEEKVVPAALEGE